MVAVVIHPRLAQHLLAETAGPIGTVPVVLRIRACLVMVCT